MRRLSPPKLRLRIGFGLALVLAATYAASVALVTAADTPEAKPTKTAAATPAGSKADKKAAKQQLDGATLYQINCSRCHSERYATEFTAAQWKTLITHMRVRANLPAKQARLVLKYLQEDSGN